MSEQLFQSRIKKSLEAGGIHDIVAYVEELQHYFDGLVAQGTFTRVVVGVMSVYRDAQELPDKKAVMLVASKGDQRINDTAILTATDGLFTSGLFAC